MRLAPSGLAEVLEISYDVGLCRRRRGSDLTWRRQAWRRDLLLESRPHGGIDVVCAAAVAAIPSASGRSKALPTTASPLRRLNARILDKASVQANTLPSGHVAGAVAAALALMALSVTIGWTVMLVAVAIGVAAIVGRYHYAVDCVAGAVVAPACSWCCSVQVGDSRQQPAGPAAQSRPLTGQ